MLASLAILSVQIAEASIRDVVREQGNYVVVFGDKSTPFKKEQEKMIEKAEAEYKGRFTFYQVDKSDKDAEGIYQAMNFTEYPAIAAVVPAEGGPQWLLKLTSYDELKEFLRVKLIDLTDLQPYSVESELDLLMNYEFLHRQDAVIVYQGNNCSDCSLAKLEAAKVAAERNLQLYVVDCDRSFVMNQLCARREVRGFPFVQVLRDGQFVAFQGDVRQVPTYKTIVEAFDVPLSDSPRELFTE